MTSTLNTGTKAARGRTVRHLMAAFVASLAFAAVAPAAANAAWALSTQSGNCCTNASGTFDVGTTAQGMLPSGTKRFYLQGNSGGLPASNSWSIKFDDTNVYEITSVTTGSTSTGTNGGQCVNATASNAPAAGYTYRIAIRQNNSGIGGSTINCYFDVRIKSGATTGSKSQTMTWSGGSSGSATITGTVAANNPSSSISGSGAFSDTIQGDTSANTTYVLTNNGNVTLSSPSTQSITGTDSTQFAIASTTCGATIAPAASCNVVVNFKPTSAGAKTATLNVTPTFNSTNYGQTVSLTGTGLAQTYTASPQTTGGVSLSSYSFADTVLGQNSSTYQFDVKNTGNKPLTLAANGSSVALSGTNSADYTVTANTCTATLAVNATCAVTVRFNPTSSGGAKSASITVTPTNSADGTNTIATAGTVSIGGTALAQTFTSTVQTTAGADLTSNAFADTIVGNDSSGFQFNVKNTGNTAMTFGASGASFVLSGTNSSDFVITANACTGSLAAGSSCAVTVKFEPRSDAGARSATLTITPSNTSDTDHVVTADTIDFTGTAIAQTRLPAIYDAAGTTAVTSQDYGSLGLNVTSANFVYTLKNDGNFTLQGTGSANQSISGTDSGNFSITGTTCGTTLAPGASCTITTTFTPTSGGSKSASLDVATTDGNGSGGSTVSVALTGTGVDTTFIPELYESDGTTALTAHDFGDTVGTLNSAVYTFKLKNAGTGVLTGVTNQTLSGTDADQFTITSTTCSADGLLPATTCNVSVRFNPTTAGAKTASLDIATTNGTPASLSVALTGNSVQAVQTPTTKDGSGNDISSYAFADTINTQNSATYAITVKNTGNVALSGINTGQALTGDNASDFTITATTCSASIAVNGTCTVTVRFNPATAGDKTANLVITPSDRTNVDSSSATVVLTGHAVQAVQTAAPQDGSGNSVTTHAFPDTINTQLSATWAVTVKNTGNVALSGINTGQALTGDNASDFTITATTCTASIAVNGTCTVTVRFNPATAGDKTANLVITPSDRTNVDKNVGTVTLTGHAVQATQIATVQNTAGSAAEPTHAFPDTIASQTSASYAFTIRNTGNVTLNAPNAQALSGTDSASFTKTATTCGATLAVNATCTVTFTFNPSSAGAKTATFTITPTAQTNVNATNGTVTLTGNAIAIQKIPSTFDTAGTTATTSYTFPSTVRTQSNSYTFVLKNTGNLTLNGTGSANQSISGTDSGNFSITSTTCGASLAVNATCNIVVRFLPTTMGAKSANLVINTTDGTSNNPATVAMTGPVVQDTPTLAYYDTAGTTPITSRAYGKIAIGSNSAYTIVLKNTGNVPITNPSTQSVTGTNAARFVKTSTTCTTSLAVNATCNIVVTYTPTTISSDTATLNVTGTEASKALPLTGSGGGIQVLNNGTQNTRGSIASRQWQDTVDIGARGSYGSTFRAGFDVAVEPGHTITDVLVNPSSATSDTDPGGTYQYVTGDVKVYQQPGGGGHVYVRVSQPITALTSWSTGIGDGLLGLCLGSTSSTTNRRIFFKLKDDQGNLTAALPANVGIDDASFACGGYPLLDAQKVVSVDGVTAASGTTEAVTTPGKAVVYSFVGHGKGGGFNGVNWRIRNAATGAMFVKNSSGGWNTCAAPCTSGFVSGYSTLSQADNTTGQITASFPSRGRWVVEGFPTGTNADGNAVQYIGSALVNSQAGSTSATSPQISVSGAPSDHPNTNSSWTMTATLTDTADSTNTYDSVGGSGATIEWDLNNDTTDGPNADGFETRYVAGYALTSADLSQVIDLTGKTPGPFTIRARVTDNGALSAADPSRASTIYTKTITINTPPVATNQTVDIQADASQPAGITLAGTDANGDSLTFSVPNLAGTGTLSGDSGTGAARTYSWPSDFTGHDTYTFVANDGHNATGNGTLTVRVHPNTQIDAGTPAADHATQSTSAHIEFSSPQTGVTGYECRLLNDGTVIRNWVSCSSTSTGSVDYTGLPDGVERFEVRAVNADGQSDGTPAAREWRVDTTAPTVNVRGPASNQPTVQPRPTNDTTPSYSFTVNDRSPEATITYECRVLFGPDSGNWHSCGGASTSSGSGTVDLIGADTLFGLTDALAEGTYSLEVRATDEVGNVGPAKRETFKVDTTTPISSFTAGAEGLVNLREQRFGVNSNEAGSAFHCRLVGNGQGVVFDGTCPGANGFPVFSGLADDVYTLSVSAIDPATNEDPAPVAQHFEVDATEPTTSLTSTLPAVSKSRRVELTFSGADSRALKQFECRRDSSSDLDWQTCQSPESFGGLAEGNHKIEIRAVDEAGNRDSSPESISWKVDNTAPTTTIDASPAADSSAAAPTVTFHANESASSRCQLDGGAWAACTSPVDVNALNGGPIGQGAHRIRVLSTDPAGNAETTGDAASWRTDTIAPQVNLVQKPNNPAAKGDAVFGFTVRDGSPAVTSPDTAVTCSIDGADFAACSSPLTLTNPSSSSHTVRIKATDAAGNVSSVVSWTWTVTASDVAPPRIDSSNPAAGSVARTGDAQFAFSHANEDSVTLECRVDARDWDTCTSPSSVRGLSEGEHTFQVRAVDGSGNRSDAASATWTVNTAPPGTVLDGAPAGRSRAKTGVFKFSSNAQGATFECQLDRGDWAACESPYETPELSDGRHNLKVRATFDGKVYDPTPISRGWTIDTVAPETTITQQPTGVIVGREATVAFASNDRWATFQCKLDDGDYATCASPTLLTKLTEGAHTFSVRAVDPYGNRDDSAAQAAWQIQFPTKGGGGPVTGSTTASLTSGQLILPALDQPIVLPAGSLSFTGDVSDTGEWTVTKDGVTFPTIRQALSASGLNVIANISITAVGAGDGALPKNGGTASMSFPAQLKITLQTESGAYLVSDAAGCYLRPIDFRLTGTYDAGTKVLSLDQDHVLFPKTSAGCGGLGSLFDSQLGLPRNDVSVHVEFAVTQNASVSGSIASVRRGATAVPVRCGKANDCAGRVLVNVLGRGGRKTRIAAANFNVARDRKASVGLKLSDAGRKALDRAGAKGLPVSVELWPAHASKAASIKRVRLHDGSANRKGGKR